MVPTKRFACLSDLLARSIERDIQLLHSLDSYTRQLFKATVADKRATEMHDQGMASEYAYETYFRFAREAREEVAEALEQAKGHKEATNTASRVSIATSDSVRALVESLQLLPSTTVASFPILTDSGPDSFVEGSKTLLKPVCPR